MQIKVDGEGVIEKIIGVDVKPLETTHEKLEFIEGDVRKAADWKKALEGVTVVVHLAAETGTGQSITQQVASLLVGRPNLVDTVLWPFQSRDGGDLYRRE